jgi:uncharacterized protein (DUF488 family)
MDDLYTIGHSTHTVERLFELLRMHGVSAVADVRSSPYSRYNSQFNREALQHALQAGGIEYVFLGGQLGARPTDTRCYADGKVQFDHIARSKAFAEGLALLRTGIESYRTALLCAEKDPIGCHRMILVCRALRGGDVRIRHILEDGELETNEHAERRLMQQLDVPETDLFATPEELIARAYDIQAGRIAYEEKGDG